MFAELKHITRHDHHHHYQPQGFHSFIECLNVTGLVQNALQIWSHSIPLTS